jgi:long-chain acyl-CoA synthetase
VPLERASSLSELLARADKIFKRGDSLLIFPEGTRSRNGELQKFRAGAAALALTHGIDVLPVSLGGTHQAFPRGALIPDWDVPLSVRIGNVITAKSLVNATKRMERTEAQQAVTQMIQKAVLDLATCGKKPAVKAAATHAHEEKRAHE